MAILGEYQGMYRISIPPEYIQKKGWKKGDALVWSDDLEGLRLTDAKPGGRR